MKVNQAKDYLNTLVIRKLCEDPKRGFYEFFRLAWHTVEKAPLTTNWHIEYLCYILQKEVERIAAGGKRDKDLIINIPPRSTKSMITTVMLNAWAWTKYPHLKFITISYSATLAEKHSIKTKNIIESKWYQKHWGHVFRYSRKKNTNKEYWTDKGGMRFASSVGGTVTGDGADIVVGDDLLNPMESESKKQRESAVIFYRDTLTSRLNDPSIGLFCLINQRTHVEDVTGIELNDNPEFYKYICIPAESSYPIVPDLLRKFYTDGLFDPVRFPAEELRKIEKKMTNYSGQYGQQPSKPGGNIIKGDWFFRWDMENLVYLAARSQERIIWNFVIDGAYTKNSENSATVCLCYTLFNGKYWIKDLYRDWVTITEFVPELKIFLERNGYSYESMIRVEPKASGLDIIDMLTEAGYNAMQSLAPKDKILSAHGIAPTLKTGRAGVRKGVGWAKEYFEELESFPNGSHDDQLDVTVIMIRNDSEGGDILASG